MPSQFDHQRLTESHDLALTFAFRVEVRTSLAAAHGQTGKAVLKRLLETQEFQDTQRHRRVKSHPALVRPDRIVELHTPRAVRANVALIVFPTDSKDHDPIWFG